MSEKLQRLLVLVLLVVGCQVAVGRTRGEKMSTYAGNPVYPTAITIPDDGDTKPAASVDVALEGLADRTTYLSQVTVEGTKEIDWFSSGNGLIDKFDSQYAGPVLTMGWLQTDNSGPGFVWLEVGNHETYYQFQSVLVYVRAAGHGALPANTPQITLYRWRDPYSDNDLVALNTPIAGVAGTGGDPSLSQAAYDTAHNLLISLGAVETIDRRAGAAYPYARYFLKLEGEYGANSAANSLIFKSGRMAPGLFG